jgi:hypothetical protein
MQLILAKFVTWEFLITQVGNLLALHLDLSIRLSVRKWSTHFCSVALSVK